MVKKRRGGRSYRRDMTVPDQEKSFGSGLDEVGFDPLGRRIVVESGRNAQWPLQHATPSGAYYDSLSGHIVVEFDNGSTFTVPVRSLETLADASESDIAEVKIVGGAGLHWERLDLVHEIGPLMRGIFGTRSWRIP
ncbi:DUF2442 domain-containing protein [Rhizobium sp. NZLR8]|uniref:DUF2442 domain-containing protein n=1 Tax=Rhizobium sp. NZLR8 TaxID=2731104 RepID=UPI001C82E4FF|nr:DUF2442 domain-containing protein [Rhizobium sp. NZLR8]MBX5157601.1 DUF2442 domain-containing protein [Rhizobium sp. NZLR8]